MTQSTMIPETTIGIDLGDKKSHICVLIEQLFFCNFVSAEGQACSMVR